MEEKQNDFLEQVSGENTDSSELAYKQAKENLELHEHAVDEMVKEVELQRQLNEVVKKNPKPLTMTHEFHNDPKFWELNAKLNDIAFDRKIVELEMRLEQSKGIVETKRAEVLRLKGE